MFDRGVGALLENLPTIGTFDAESVRRLLTDAFLDVVETRDLNGSEVPPEQRVAELRRLATALELHAVLAPDIPDATAEACAFVAAEALEVYAEFAAQLDEPLRYYGGVDASVYAAVEAAALYLVAGYDANAAVASRAINREAIDADLPEAEAISYALDALRAFFQLRGRARARRELRALPDTIPLNAQVRWELWRRLGSSLDDHVRWLRIRANAPEDVPARLNHLAERLESAERHADIHHVLVLAGAAAASVQNRALRTIEPPDRNPEIWDAYVRGRVRERPLLWPAAQRYVREALPNLRVHAVVSVPTGAGKTEVAELATAQALAEGWVLYLAPTNALVGQVLRDLAARFREAEGVRVRAFLGGAEYTEFEGESFEEVAGPQILVMTPEKCSLALRQAPEAFSTLRLIILDECHLLADPSGRGVVAELVVAELMHRARDAVALLLSALVSNADELADWLGAATDVQARPIQPPWRPTRTVRAVLGIDPDGANAAFQEAVEVFNANPRRRRVTFEAPVALLANLQGAWHSTDAEDYAVVNTDLTAPLTARRFSDGTVAPEPTGYVNPTCGRLTTALASRGHRVLTFLPANKHYSFSVARDLDPLEPRLRRNARLEQIDAHLDLAELELGLETPLRELIERGAAVHTAAMLRDEQRASELAFEDGQAVALFATTTLAQGLNLPATAVVIGGTRVGHDPDVPVRDREERERAQLLNAIGRAGRAYVASRSLAIVIPDRWVVVRPATSASRARDRAPFLEFDDASTQVRGQTEGIIEQALTTTGLAVDLMSVQEQTAFAFLSMAEARDRREVVRKSFGAYRVGITADEDRAARVAFAVERAGDTFVAATGAPPWISQASHIAGIGLPATAALFSSATQLIEGERPTTIESWLGVLTRALAQVTPTQTRLTLPGYLFEGTRAAPLFDEDAEREERAAAATALAEIGRAWMTGEPLTDVAAAALGDDARDNPGRASGNPIPKIIGVVEQGLGFGLARASGALAAFAHVAAERDSANIWALGADAREELDLLPLAIRFGCNDLPTTAWYRWGFRRRRIAHMLARALPPPPDLSGEALASWIFGQRRVLLREDADMRELDEEARRAVVALRRVESR